MRFIAKILDGFVIQQAIHRLGIRFLIRLVHLPAKTQAPIGENQREGDIGDDGAKHGEREGSREHPPKNDRDEQNFDNGRNDVEQQEIERCRDAAHAPFNHTGKPACRAVHMKAHGKRVQMAKHVQGHAAPGARLHLGKHGIA